MWIVAALVLLAAAFTGGGRNRKRTRARGGWVDGDAPAQIRELAARLETIAGWPGLADYLVAVAWTESRGSLTAKNGSSRGWFQLHPRTAAHPAVLENPALLFDPRWAVATAADLAVRLIDYWRHPGLPPWLALRRGWAYPSLVSDTDETEIRSSEVRQRFEAAITRVGLPDRFIYQTAFPPGFQWPGIDAALRAVGVSSDAVT